MKAAVLLIAAVSVAGLWQKMSHPTNSEAAAARGASAFEHKRPADAVTEFATAASIRPTPASHFNLGTAQIAAGERDAGAATLGKTLTDPSLRARALYNRGNSALAANAYENAIRDYTDALRFAPADREAKRNLEIALRRQESMQQEQQSGGKNQQQGSGKEQQQKTPQASNQKQQQEGEADAEALLRSVQQQEQEELMRMKRARGDSRRVGW